MTIQQLEQLVGQLALTCNLNQNDIIQDLADYAGLKYGNNISVNERKIIDAVKNKLLKGLYKMSNNSYVSNHPDYKEKFGLDKLELDALPQAATELIKEGLIENGECYIKLTDTGILESKRIRGEL